MGNRWKKDTCLNFRNAVLDLAAQTIKVSLVCFLPFYDFSWSYFLFPTFFLKQILSSVFQIQTSKTALLLVSLLLLFTASKYFRKTLVHTILCEVGTSEAFQQTSRVLSHVRGIFAILHSWNWCWTLATVIIPESHEFTFHIQVPIPPLHFGVDLTWFTLPPEVSGLTWAVHKFLQCLCQVTPRRVCSGVLH